VIYSVRAELEVSIGPGEHVRGYADRLHAQLRELTGGAVLAASALFHTRRSPYHGITTAALTIEATDQAKAATAALKILRAAAAHDAAAWELRRAKVTITPGR
jgi:hypothetical protein